MLFYVASQSRVFNFPIFVSGCQLAASSLNVRAEVLSHGVVDFILSKDGLEFLDDRIGGFLEGSQSVAAIVFNKVDVEEATAVWGSADEVGEGGGVSNAVIDVFEEDVGEEDFAVGDGQMLVNGGHNLLDGIGGGDGHEFGPFVVEGVVEGEGEVDLGIFGREFFNSWNDANSGNGQVAGGEAKKVFVGHQVDGGEGVVRIGERLAHAHEDN